MTCKIKKQYDIKYKSWTRNNYLKEKYGFSGTYTNKNLGRCEVRVTQDLKNNYYLILSAWTDEYEYQRAFTCSERPTTRMAGLKARAFMIELNDILSPTKVMGIPPKRL